MEAVHVHLGSKEHIVRSRVTVVSMETSVNKSASVNRPLVYTVIILMVPASANRALLEPFVKR